MIYEIDINQGIRTAYRKILAQNDLNKAFEYHEKFKNLMRFYSNDLISENDALKKEFSLTPEEERRIKESDLGNLIKMFNTKHPFFV